MGQPWSPTPPSLFVNGNSSLGKSTVVKAVFSRTLGGVSPSRYAFLDCVECHTPRLIFEHAIHQWQNPPPASGYNGLDIYTHSGLDNTTALNPTKGDSEMPNATESRSKKRPRSADDTKAISWERCENVNEFVEWCRRICDQPDSSLFTRVDGDVPLRSRPKGAQDTRYLVFDQAERLRDSAPLLIPVLLRLQELTIAILERDLPEGDDKDLYMRFVDLVYDVFQRNCKDLNEIRHLVALLFPLYIKPVKEGKIQRHEGLKLLRHIQAYFVEAMDKLYLREISSTEWSQRTLQAASGASQGTLNDSSTGSGTTRPPGAPGSERAMMTAVELQNTFDLPYFTKFILIASFLASYNPPRLDMRYFAKVSNQGGKMTKRAKTAAAKKHGHEQLGSKLRQQLLGPKPFPIERMLAILYSILDEEIEENVNVHTQIASLVSLRLLQRVTPMDKLDSIKCKCNVSYDTIKELAKSTKFNIDKYLYDFT
ncbi:Origin recognition complex subunit 5 [Lunasporangiospora selenospora]|uniref:Origin recognition complex subunit 5 n=1 Tax=Lunasporangiospora selenospora TaxID=979761 RepID=A0A9P6FZC6_9FUNG|nr:Origin recognition complex subunit 5 [Lunasporangiospora selenospora]